MRYSSEKMLSYIAEAGFGSGSDKSSPGKTPGVFGPPDPPFDPFEKVKTRSSSTSSTGQPKGASKPTKALVDRSLMGDDPDLGGEDIEGAAQLATIPIRARLGLRGIFGALGKPITDIATSAQQAEDLVAAQQTAVRNMANVNNYYRNLGVAKAPSMGKQDLSSMLQSIFNLLPTGGRPARP